MPALPVKPGGQTGQFPQAQGERGRGWVQNWVPFTDRILYVLRGGPEQMILSWAPVKAVRGPATSIATCHVELSCQGAAAECRQLHADGVLFR